MTIKAEVIQTVDGMHIKHIIELENLFPFMEVCGASYMGINNNPRTRAELQGQPKFSGFCGPMYGGPGLIRYEDIETYNALSI